MTGILLSLPPVQTKLAQYLTEKINEDYGTDIKVDKVAISIFGSVKLNTVMIRDYKKDTLIYANRIQTNILSFKRLYGGDLLFGDIRADGMVFNMKTYKGERETNLDKFLKLFDEPGAKPSGRKFLLKADNLYVSNSRFILLDENRQNPKDADFRKLDGRIKDFMVYGPEVTMDIRELAFMDYRGLYVKNLTALFKYNKTNISLKNLDVNTAHSLMKGDVLLTYVKSDFSDFNNKVKFDINVKQATLATNDIYYFYKEMGRNKYFSLTSHVTGTLNNLYAQNLKLKDEKGSEIIGDVRFKNLFGKTGQNFYMNGTFDRVYSDYQDLVDLLPNVLGKKLPTNLKKLGKFNMSGRAEITTSSIDTELSMTTSLGNIKTEIVMTDIGNIDNAEYTGHIILDNFDIGNFLDKRDLGIVSLDVDVDGKGFKQEYMDTSFSGDIFKIRYRDYVYSNILVNGNFTNPVFEGQVFVNDPNLFMDFDGKVNLGKKEIEYDFHTKIDYANLGKMRWVKNDSIAVFKGDISTQISGNSIDDLQGNIHINQTSYQNKRDIYYFEDFSINVSFDQNRVRTIAINSPDIIEGEIVGKYKFDQMPKMIENSLGSLYANYTPYKIAKGQYMKFNFAIYNKVLEIFLPGITIGPNTQVAGSINSDNNDFKFRFDSPQIGAYENYFDNVRIQVDNKNPLYNAYVEMDSIRTKWYKISDFSALNVTARDTLFVRTEFKGGPKGQDAFNLNLYHTLDKQKNVIVGFNKSELKYKDYVWYLNEDDQDGNKVVMDRSFKNFNFDNFTLSHYNERMKFNGLINGKNKKDLTLSFDHVDLSKFTPDSQNFRVKGSLNGTVSLKQDGEIYQPMSSVRIDNLFVNETEMGNLVLDVDGDDSFRKFYVNSVLENKNFEAFRADGEITVSGGQTLLDVDMRFDRFNLAMLNALLSGEAISDIKGFASGNARIDGAFSDPDVNGRLYLDDASLKVPYLNTQYEMDKRSVVDVTETQFLIRNTGITDTKYKTVGTLEGRIEHKKFADWELDLNIASQRLLALDTQDSDDAAYYGTAFINGTASISGPTNGLFIKVDAKSEQGTSIKVPINNTESTGSRSYIHFLSPKEKYNLEKGIVEQVRNYNGLELEFDFDITPEAEVEVIIDKNSGHSIKGKGFGSLLFKINTLGKFNMWGDFQAYEGIYNFKYGGLIDKKFALKKGGSITWEGDPMRAVLNMEAVYKTTANPAILLENPSVNKKVPVEVVIGVRGNLSNPEPDFAINFPTVSSVLKSEIQYKLDDKDTRQTQALYLLSSGTFLSPEGVNESDFAGNLFETASGLIGDIFQDPDSNIKVGVDFVAADRRPGTEADGRVGFTVSTQVSDRITINGKVGVPVGGVNESAIVGDVEVQYRVNEDGTMNLRVFNRENDINYIGQGIGYTQGVGITYEVDFDTFKELINKLFKNTKIDLEKADSEVPDSYIHEGMNFTPVKDKKQKKPTTSKPNTEAVPPPSPEDGN
ncbi:translocation/assembly module TamB domain-containing protein [Flavobacterium sp. MAH-1]|uniref:Translocation/assembly module TamB domain-containing protein n=1 Tax=Flavobacterium agri TaxID=2743471 RepID=A0A7Y9C648_9FLAO|nr:translocation/assembly module TamB domain-containing protein [Flavobacterium agri]NUY79983.1 translocation/assembly module TamB domain-containing protein [Flavobacterium agri]NYA70008.1 translocation/assembly module TamB domain-containing protein [Flavobacterium agri]